MSRNVQICPEMTCVEKSKGFLCNLIVLRRRRNSLMKQYRGELEPAVLAQNGRTGAMICQNGDDVLQSISMRKWIGLGRYRQPIFHYGRFVNGIHHGKNGFRESIVFPSASCTPRLRYPAGWKVPLPSLCWKAGTRQDR